MKVTRVLLCRPTYFVVDYIINPHMQPHSVDQAKAMQQWEALKSSLESLQITVEVIEQAPDVPDMVFATDQGIVQDGRVLLANFRFSQRKKESQYYRKWFTEHGFGIRSLSNVFPFEGGDTLFFGDMLFVGTGYRASVASCEELSKKLDKDVIPLRLVDPAYYHLDTCFFPLGRDTAFYYPPAFSPNSQSLLKKLVPNLLEMDEAEAAGFAANSFVSDKTVLIETGVPTFKTKLEQLGYNVVELDMSEFNKSGGGIHCLINTLEKE